MCAAPRALTDFRRLLQNAEHRVAEHPQSSTFLTTAGALLYRSGNLNDAKKRLNQAIAAFGTNQLGDIPIIYPQLLQAMCQWQLGNKTESRSMLASTQPAIEQMLRSSDTPWNRRLTVELLQKEATSLIVAEESRAQPIVQK